MTVESNPSGGCSFDYSGFWLFPATLSVDLSSYTNVTSASFDLTDFCGIGCTVMEAYSNGVLIGSISNSLSSTGEVLTISQAGIDEVKIYSFEVQLNNFSFTFNPPASNCQNFEIEQGDVVVKDPTKGVILTSPNGSCYRITVDDNGNLTTIAVTCP